MSDTKKRTTRDIQKGRISTLYVADRLIKAKEQLSENGDIGRIKLIDIDNVTYEIVASYNHNS